MQFVPAQSDFFYLLKNMEREKTHLFKLERD